MRRQADRPAGSDERRDNLAGARAGTQPNLPRKSTLVNALSAAPQDDSTEPPSGSLPKGLALIELLSSEEAPMGISALARHMNMPKSGVHRLLQMMRASGWVQQTPDGNYECTLKLWAIGQRVAKRVDLRKTAAAAMSQLAAQTRETILLSILDGTDVLYVDVIGSPQPVRVHTSPGDRAPAHCVATGKAMLAHAPPALVDAVARKLHAVTATTITTREQLDTELERVRSKGFAVNRDEWGGSVHGVAAPIFDGRGQVVAAISVGGPGERMTVTAVRQIAPWVMEAAASISRQLGYQGREPGPRTA